MKMKVPAGSDMRPSPVSEIKPAPYVSKEDTRKLQQQLGANLLPPPRAQLGLSSLWIKA